MRQPELRSAIIRSGVTESMPFHDVTAAAVLYGEFSAIAVTANSLNAIIYLGLRSTAGCRYVEPAQNRSVQEYAPIAAARQGVAGKCAPSVPSH